MDDVRLKGPIINFTEEVIYVVELFVVKRDHRHALLILESPGNLPGSISIFYMFFFFTAFTR